MRSRGDGQRGGGVERYTRSLSAVRARELEDALPEDDGRGLDPRRRLLRRAFLLLRARGVGVLEGLGVAPAHEGVPILPDREGHVVEVVAELVRRALLLGVALGLRVAPQHRERLESGKVRQTRVALRPALLERRLRAFTDREPVRGDEVLGLEQVLAVGLHHAPAAFSFTNLFGRRREM